MVFVVHDEPDRLRSSMLEGLEVPYPVVIDLDQAAYREWGLRRASRLGLYLSPTTWRGYARVLRGGGERLRPPGRDTLQMGGDFVVGGSGRVTYSRPQTADDRPPVGVLVNAIDEASGRGDV